MFSSLANLARSGMNMLKAGLPLGLKTLKYFIDSTFRDQVTPEPGSVLYCDLWVAVEHSGIYLGDGAIANIVVDGLAESTVCRSSPHSFTSKSTLGRKIYVSCNGHGAVGHPVVARGADAHVGERAFYGLVIKNCHQFSSKCVNYVDYDAGFSLWEGLLAMLPGDTWEPTMANLKSAARKKLGASKWRLWDWDGDIASHPPPEPDWAAHADFFRHQPLNPESIAGIRAELAATQAYEAEIADEAIPDAIRRKLGGFRQTLDDVAQQYDKVKDFLAACPGASFSFAELQACTDDFAALAHALQHNAAIQELARKMGRNYISEEKKQCARIPQASKSEVHGTHRSDDLMRVLPSELLNLEDDTLETLFFARLLEKNLLTYELQGTTFIQGEHAETRQKRTGPVVACLDTSGSMQGAPLLKAKALLLAIANILRKEDRSLHVLLFGSAGEIREFSMDRQNDAAGLLTFLQQGFGGGTDFATPLQRAFGIVSSWGAYQKADVLMISDGDDQLPATTIETVRSRKQLLDCRVYSVLCAGARVSDGFSDEVIVL
jgi:hypothetical protein